MKQNVRQIEKTLKINFKNKNLLRISMIHKSFDKNNNNEKLEFLGDRVIALVISKKLLSLYPNEKEGIIDKRFASLVNKKTCAQVAIRLNLKASIKTGNSYKNLKSSDEKILSDACEALIGAIYLDKGLEVSKSFILKLWKNLINEAETTFVDAKTQLQEYSLKNYKILPIYKLISNTGPRHKPNFKVGVKLKNSTYIYAIGSSKKNAEQSAALELLKKIKQK